MHNRIPRPAAVPRSDADTPPSGLPLPSDIAKMTTHELALHAHAMGESYADRLRTLIQESREREQALRTELTADAGRIDALMQDVRKLCESTRVSDAERKRLEEAVFALQPLPNESREHARAIAHLSALVKAIDERLGQPPQDLANRQSRSGQHTAAELIELEQGTGVAGVVGRLVAQVSRQEARLATIAIVTPIALKVAESLTAAYAAIMACVLVVGLCAMYGFRIARRKFQLWRLSRPIKPSKKA